MENDSWTQEASVIFFWTHWTLELSLAVCFMYFFLCSCSWTPQEQIGDWIFCLPLPAPWMSAHLCSGKDFLQTFRVFLAILVWKAHKSSTVWGVTLQWNAMQGSPSCNWLDLLQKQFRGTSQSSTCYLQGHVMSCITELPALLFWRISIPWWWCCLMVQHSLSHSFKEVWVTPSLFQCSFNFAVTFLNASFFNVAAD